MTEQTQQPTERLMRLDLWILVVLGALGVAFFLFKFTDSFPSASVDLRTPKTQIVEKG